jgi:hypothetical protein
MQQSIIKFIALSYRRCSTCFGHYYAHHQEPFQTAVAVSDFRMNAEVDVFPSQHSYGNQRLQRQFERAPDDGHNNARNMLSSVYMTK